MEPSPSTGSGVEVDDAPGDANQRVHHHARTDHDEQLPAGSVLTLCGLRMSGPRPEAAELPCCPMCNAEMAALGHRCRR